MADETAAVVIPTEAPAAAPVVAVAAPTGPAAANAAVPAQTEAQKIEAAVVKFAEGARIEISTEEKLFGAKLENEFLRANMEIQRLTKIVENAQKQFPQFIEGLVKKYAINPATHQFHNIEQVFVKKA